MATFLRSPEHNTARIKQTGANRSYCHSSKQRVLYKTVLATVMSEEPPAKRARLEADAPFTGASSFDAPGSPVDDLDDDFYDTTPAKPAALSAPHEGPAASLTATAPAPSSFSLPGLGSLGDATITQPTPHIDADTVMNNAVHGEGELKDEEAFSHDASAVEPPVANQLQALDEAPQHGKPSRPELHAASLTLAQDASEPTTTTAPALDFDQAVTESASAVNAPIKQEPSADAAPAGEAQDPTADESKAEFLRIGEANKDNKDAEWQLDSDASDSSSDSSSSDSSDDEADDGELMDPEEMVRLLMAESADEAGATGKAKVKTLNEVEEKYEKPDIKVENETQITELGRVEAVVDNLILVKANTSGDYQVLESGSALCLRDFTIIGKISEQIGRVEEPRYSVGFNDPAEIATLGISKDTPIYYVDAHSTFVFTEPLRNQKHTDASNLHDEETNEVEFSDDEAEAEFKRQQKQAKKARQEAKNDPEPQPEPKPIPTGPRGHVDKPVSYFSAANEYQGGGLKYSDDEDEDLGMYKPLARPSHFEEIVGHGAPLEDRSHVRRGMMRGRGGWGDRGRGFRGRGNFGGRGDFAGGRGDFSGGRGGRGDARGGRGDRGGGDRGGRGGNNNNKQADRGRPQNQQQDNRQMSVPQDNRSGTSASPARQQERQQSSQPQHSPPAKSKNKNRKQRQREKREREAQEKAQQQQQQQQQQNQQNQQQQSQQQQQHASPTPSGPSNANSYANNSSTGWPTQYPQPAAAGATYPPAPPPAAAPTPAQYGQQPAAQVQPNQQANWAAWAQWFQVVGAMSQQGTQAQQPQAQPQPQQWTQPQAQAPAPPPQPQAQAQYGYQQQWQYPQNAAPAPNTNAQQPNAQAGAQSLQDILRALGGGGGGQA